MQTSGFFNSTVGADGSYDRQYVAEQFAEYFASFVGNGVFQSISNALLVTEASSPSMSVTVQAGQGWINGYWYKNSTELPLSVAISDGVLGRIDLVVLQLGFSERTIQCVVKTGTPAASPVAPTLQRDNDYYELELAQVNVPAGAVNVRNANIVDMRSDTSVCGFVQAAVQSIDTTYFGNQLNSFISRYIAQADADYEEYEQAIEGEYDRLAQEFSSLLERLRDLVDDDDALGQLVLDMTQAENDISSNTTAITNLTGTVSGNDTALRTILRGKENRYTKATATVATSGWTLNSSTGFYEYSFTGTYPTSSYDLEIDLNWDSVSEDAAKDWQKSYVVGSYSSNKLVARSKKPEYAYPVVIYVTSRATNPAS